MNFFEFHLGDYAEATGHLTFIEDAAYMRLLRKCYATERPIPADIAAAQRLVGARTDEERAAVDTVLREFFELREDGWHQARVDSEIERFKEGEPEREVKKANEANRLRRHRDERAALFKRLTDAGQHAAWNIPIGELRELVSKLPATAPAETESAVAAAPETPPETLVLSMTATEETPPTTAPATLATATQYPLPTTQYPEETHLSPAAGAAKSRSRSTKAKAEHPLFAEFYAAYPRKVSREDAARAFDSLNPDSDLLAMMLRAIAAQGLVQRCAAGDKQFVPHPATWLNKRRWEDEADGTVTGGHAIHDESPAWLRGTGFANVFEASNAGCGAGNAHRFRNREEVPA